VLTDQEGEIGLKKPDGIEGGLACGVPRIAKWIARGLETKAQYWGRV